MVRPGDGPWASLGDEIDLLCQIADDLPLTLHAYVIANTAEDLRAASDQLAAAGPRLIWKGLKRFADGSLGGHTAAMWEPYSDATNTRGTLRLSGHDATLAQTCIDLGGSVAVHAIGDRACAEVIDLFAALIGSGAAPTALRLEHASVLAPTDIQRIARLGVVASVQPAFIGSETGWLETRVGSDRIRTTYAFRTLLRSGVTVAAGSDCPVEPPNPWPAMALARDRAGFVPEESVSASAALGMFTDGAARALGEPVPLEPGSPADFVVVDRDPLTASSDELRDLDVVETFVAGSAVEVDRTVPTWND
jgi:predicted amidohydrolase YtcJ